MCTESSLNSTGSIEDKKSINESLSTEVELNVEDVCKNETDCTELNETTSNTEDSLDSFELVDYPDPSEIQIAGFNKEKLAQMCTFSKMTYGNNDTKLFQAGYKTIGSFISEDYSVIPFYYCSGRQAGFVFTKDREITIAYRGTQDFADIITDLLAMLVPLEFLPEGGRVHYGFYYSFCDSQDSLFCVLENYAKEQKLEIKDFKFYLTGHSMGGAIAKIAALYLSKVIGAQDLHVATFADPRVFDLTASESYSRALPNRTVRVTQHRYDPVPAVAPGLFGYVHVGEQLRVSIASWYTVHKIDGYYQAINAIKESDFQPDNSTSIFYYPVRGLILINSAILGNAQYYAYNFLRYFSYQNTPSIGFCAAEDSKIVPYESNPISMIASNSLGCIYGNTQLKDTKICELDDRHQVTYMVDFELSNRMSILDFPAGVSTTINNAISVKLFIDTNFSSKNDDLFKGVAKLAVKSKKILALPAEAHKSNTQELLFSKNSSTEDVSKISSTTQDLDFAEQQENSPFDNVSFNVDDEKEEPAESSITQDDNLSNKSLEPEGNDSKLEFDEARQTINAHNEDGFTLLHLAAQKGDVEEGKRLIQLGADIEITSKTKGGRDTALHLAAQKGHSNFVELLLDSGADVNKASATGSGVTPLHEAAYYGHINIIGLLIARNATIDAKDRNGYSPLQYACLNGESEVTKLLLKENADPYLQNNSGETALFYVACYGNLEVISILTNAVDNKEKYINTRNYNNQTALHFIVHEKEINETHKKAIELLLKNGADPHLKDKLGQSPLDIAKKHNNKELISLFSPQNTKKSELPIVAASTLATAGVSLGIAISIYLEMLAVGITVGVCLVLSAAAVFSYYHNSQAISPKSSLETVSNTPYLKSDNIYQTSL